MPKNINFGFRCSSKMVIQKYLGMIKMTTFSMHCVTNYPAKKSKSDIDVELKEYMEDNEYLNILNNNLKKLNQNTYDFVYVAGVDIHHEDRLGKLKISDEGVNKRDQIVIENFYSKNSFVRCTWWRL